MKKIILTGIQPSGALHLGNYFGMMQPAIGMQSQGQAVYFIADYHALTSVSKADDLRRYTFDAAAGFLACGLDPQQTILFRQSDVPQVHELAWLLSVVTAGAGAQLQGQDRARRRDESRPLRLPGSHGRRYPAL
jgi:tryptophanyl-tRNA synthetase